ncbi:MAG: class B sortase [Erysipelotrichaceae bacterium]|nr:class B sortase [Erysipelotrichaceae bacterium]
MKRLIILILSVFLMCSCAGNIEKAETETSSVSEAVIEALIAAEAEDCKELNEKWDENHSINPDYVGQIKVGELFEYPFVQGETNDTYLRKDWATMNYDEEGSIFMDERNDIDDQNIIIYGHYVYASLDPDGTHKFTPLRLLKDEKNYEANRYLTLQLKDELRTYETALVLYVDTYMDENGIRYAVPELEYDHTGFEDDYFEEYIRNAKAKAFYDTGVEIGNDDRLLTLQTCVEGNKDLREIVIAKLVKKEQIR